jgi:chromate transporter
MNDLWLLFLLFVRASLLSTSGMGNVPQLYTDLTTLQLADERMFAEALAVGQISPGPSGLWVISLGYLIAGPLGALAAAIAITLPPLAVLLLDRIARRYADNPALQGFVQGLSMTVIGIFAVVLLDLFRANGVNPPALLISAAALGLAAHRSLPIILILAAGAVVGMLVYR